MTACLNVIYTWWKTVIHLPRLSKRKFKKSTSKYSLVCWMWRIKWRPSERTEFQSVLYAAQPNERPRAYCSFHTFVRCVTNSMLQLFTTVFLMNMCFTPTSLFKISTLQYFFSVMSITFYSLSLSVYFSLTGNFVEQNDSFYWSRLWFKLNWTLCFIFSNDDCCCDNSLCQNTSRIVLLVWSNRTLVHQRCPNAVAHQRSIQAEMRLQRWICCE